MQRKPLRVAALGAALLTAMAASALAGLSPGAKVQDETGPVESKLIVRAVP